MTTLGAIFPPDQPPEQLRAVAQAADAAGLEQLWVWEDCFREGGIASAAAALAWTERLTLGIGLLPVPLRNVALTAMEIATIERTFPGRFVPGIGHGVLDWMGQVGARVESPMALLREYTEALHALLAGETVTTSGRYVRLDGVALDWPTRQAPPLVVGGRGPKTVAVGGELADGVILDEQVDDDAVRAALPGYLAARSDSGRDGAGNVVVFRGVPADEPAQRTAERVTALAELGVTHVLLRSLADDVPLTDFVQRVAHEVRPLVP
ncbi:LLM class flavin-dependent oxidoreductase [uncultured Jatrophihabitans sp.]|uniref:LLM class flavin-dependent oxidoreductase n=1 Tax=uncultured Jatrophihabitans sp. TaxID=1610747 RepID=UPI0035CB4ECE